MPFPYFSESAQAAVLSATSNLIAQVIDSYQKSVPLTFNFTPLFQFVLFSLLNTPINCAWQEWLESMFPSNVPAPDPVAIEKSSEKPGEKKEVFSVKNTAIKFGLDQVFGAAFNTVAFTGGVPAIQGKSWEEIKTSVIETSWPVYLAGCTVWPAVSLLCFVAIPANKRVVFGSAVGVAWGIYLSLLAGA